MKEYILDTENSRLRAPQPKGAVDDSPRLLLMARDEFSAFKLNIPHKRNLELSLTRTKYCRVEFFGSQIQGTMFIPAETTEHGESIDFGFLLTENRLILIEDSGVLEPVIKKLPDSIFSISSLSKVLLALFEMLLENDVMCIQKLEASLSSLEETLIKDAPPHFYETIINYSKMISSLHSYYEQVMDIGDLLLDRVDPKTLPDEYSAWQHYTNRTERLHNHVERLSVYLVQIRELYQSMIAERQNKTMTLLTIITTIFLPLTLIVGWYGMNFPDMPEFRWKYGYPVIIIVSVATIIFEFIYFKKKKMF